ncbi:DeoR family transcriptional regulator, glycerol-3-phosphate regulon repressor [Saccharopolyspora antimicrobica]|uniref:Lactose phosphotransferase system repressor n=1 Tax=Saccharopolyspora antimicrobica TaxID=455193 RepID=A0A1I4W2X9_9PSEU|nr:DeoR/GlpR family DNA-binding transcription regulator [Saccharopolyspora antimicrobica]RKT87110.1 DeoR family transcriptional regulator [Saccharopolyspora antimicrobica]SFN07439.1 DeoR family transcriptional regulator, glycerol-3-phosphate regulon repressor [Saccharopolyspora antimicrobica]
MLAVERHALITEMVRSAQIVSTDTLMRELAVSGETIRRDLVALEERGVLTRVHGGAASTEPPISQEPPVEQRRRLGAGNKNKIGRAAASLVRDGQIIMIDVGTTAVAVARALPAGLSATVLTNSLVVASELADRAELDVLVSGGRVRSGDLALSNATAAGFFAETYPDIAFLGSGGLHPEAGLTDYHLEEIAVRRTVLANAHRSYALVSSEKFGRIAGHHVCSLDQLTGVVVDTEPTGDLRNALSEAAVDVVTA